jgi:hypothetical protein
MVRLGKLIAIGVAALLTTPILVHTAMAHTVKVAEDVAATFHVEPNHNPKAGRPSLVWVALTKKGGALIPLSQCNCQMAVYSLPRSNNPIARLELRSINVEQYRGAMSSNVTFPRAGRYEIELSGSPKNASFKPFRLTYTVTVGG